MHFCFRVVTMFRVSPSQKYESFRANFIPVKRVADVPNTKVAHPRLEHENANDDVKALGRRKIPSSSQRQSRGTNVPLVYSRLTTGRKIHEEDFERGDVVFVCKRNTEFDGYKRLTTVVSVSDMNNMLLDTNNSVKNTISIDDNRVSPKTAL